MKNNTTRRSLPNKMRVLNLGAGKIDLSRWANFGQVIHVDRYFDPATSATISEAHNFYLSSDRNTTQCCCKSDIFGFVDNFQYKFDLVVAERIFEHMEYVGGEIGRLLEGINTLTTQNAKLEIVVPNAILLAEMLITYEKEYDRFNQVDSLNTKLILNSELCNVKIDPHASVWTPRLAREYIESEGTWLIENIENKYRFAGRDIYMKITCKKP